MDKKAQEKSYLEVFLSTKEGQNFRNHNNIQKIIPDEQPDFIFETLCGKRIGLEITQLILISERQKALATLDSIARQVYRHFQQQYQKDDIPLSFIINVYDDRPRDRYFFTKGIYEFHFQKLNISKMTIKDKFIEVIEKWIQDPTKRPVDNIWVEIPPYIFKINISIDNFSFDSSPATINRDAIYINNPIKELQETINKKNKLLKSYKKRCNECVLLVIAENSKNQSELATFTEEINSIVFHSSFKETYVLEFDNWTKETKIYNLEKSK